MCLNDFILEYSGGIHPNGLCRVRFFNMNSTVVITDTGDLNTGPSVTNAMSSIISALKLKHYVDDSTIIIEHTEPELWFGHVFDLVSFDVTGLPVWDILTIEQACKLCNSDVDSLCNFIQDSSTLLKEIAIKAKQILTPQIKSTIIEENSANRVFKDDIENLIASGASETACQRLLEKDLSLIAEVYAMPADEYVCFSQFPILNKRADFVLFTGRSKMSVYIFEIKGAEFYFSNKSGYKKLNEKINTCRHQVVDSINQINNYNYEEFRRFCYQIRLDVESGLPRYNSLLGSKGLLHVDPNKEIQVYGVVIGGKSRDDLHESRLRYHEEKLTPNIKIESWDSWANKLTRGNRADMLL